MKKLIYVTLLTGIVGSLSLNATQRDLTVEYITQKLRTPYSEKFYVRISSDEPLEALRQWGNYYHAWIRGNTQGTMSLTILPLQDLNLEIVGKRYVLNDQLSTEQLIKPLHTNNVSMGNEQTFYDIQPGTWQDDLYNLVAQKAQQALEDQELQLRAAIRETREYYPENTQIAEESIQEYNTTAEQLAAEALKASEEIDKIIAAMSPEEQAEMEKEWASMSEEEKDAFFKELSGQEKTEEADSSRTWLGNKWEKVKRFFEYFWNI